MLKIVLLRAEYTVRALPPLPPEAWLLCRSRGLWTTWPPHQATALWDCALWLNTRYIGIGLTSTPQSLLGRSGRQESLLALAALGCPGTKLHLQPPDPGELPDGPIATVPHFFFSGGKHMPVCNWEHPQAPSSLRVTSENTLIGERDITFSTCSSARDYFTKLSQTESEHWGAQKAKHQHLSVVVITTTPATRSLSTAVVFSPHYSITHVKGTWISFPRRGFTRSVTLSSPQRSDMAPGWSDRRGWCGWHFSSGPETATLTAPTSGDRG